ncbi:MAG: hypothetical protein U1A77_17925 [Pirellulales bacterium]
MRPSQPFRSPEEVDQILLNARLRDALEPFVDESLDLLDSSRMTTADENEFLASLLAWERAPVEPISRWFTPELVLPPHETLNDIQLHDLLRDAIDRLYQRRIVLQWTDHLSDRQLYCILTRDLLPAQEKKVDLSGQYLHWRFLDVEADAELWLRYYANAEEREAWEMETGETAPPAERPPFPRELPQP